MSVSEEQLKRELRFVGAVAAGYLKALEQIAEDQPTDFMNKTWTELHLKAARDIARTALAQAGD